MSLDQKMRDLEQKVEEVSRIGERFGGLELDHTATKLERDKGSNRDFFEVRIRLVGPQQVLSDVSQVEYILHPTFNPDRITKPGTSELKLRIWGEFTVRADVSFRSGGPPVSLSRYLKLPF
jgi:hypothetical protein